MADNIDISVTDVIENVTISVIDAGDNIDIDITDISNNITVNILEGQYVPWGDITGTLVNQLDLITYLSVLDGGTA